MRWAGRRQPRRHLRFTREGTVFVLTTLGVGIAAVNTGNNLLYLMLGFMLSLIVLSGVMSEAVLRGVRLERRAPERLFAGSTSLIEIVLKNEKRHVASYSLEVEDRAEGLTAERRCYFLKVAPRAQQVAAYRRTPKHRGVLRLSGFRLATRYPFGLFETWRLLEERCDLIVYPALVPIGPITTGLPSYAGELTVPRAGPGSEVSALRDYLPGDDARAIHWRRTASLGHIVVREREREETVRLSIVVDNARPADAPPEWDAMLEHSISVAASVAAAALRSDVAVEVVARGERSRFVLPGAAPDAIWRFLALLGSVPAETAPRIERPRGTAYVAGPHGAQARASRGAR